MREEVACMNKIKEKLLMGILVILIILAAAVYFFSFIAPALTC
ncbi:hypothetical protein BRYFOR_09708 [Marvinbryantia formatexigens DSM 14469]|uniref:Uncharacterized protein n=1 Tax=Marvinbryantia formatexigens DSM 14469 TaxID=478749 RepID=C6LM09_9FIRM|nr:hypothetical protein BRYFOR_09708 [Marvinbryantia formatexigens DSM 14469]